MQKEIIAAYSGLTIASLMLVIIGSSVALKCISDKNYGPTLQLSIAITLCWIGEFINRFWFMVYREGYSSRKPVAWMLHHDVVLISAILMIISAILFIKALTEEYPSKGLWKACFFVILFTSIMIYMG